MGFHRCFRPRFVGAKPVTWRGYVRGGGRRRGWGFVWGDDVAPWSGLWVGVRQVASTFEQVVLTGAQMSGDVPRRPRCGKVGLGWGRQKRGGLTCGYPVSLSASFTFAVVVDLIVVAIAMHVLCDVALACCWVGISEREGRRMRCTYLGSW
jgi:hypothetical protein